ncbi:conserved domain protein [Acinetobacter baumannii 6013150]|nr:conserved domain protein [Acinetobacter baumannii 6013150]
MVFTFNTIFSDNKGHGDSYLKNMVSFRIAYFRQKRGKQTIAFIDIVYLYI